jgi:hypothetical protein
MVVVRVVFVFAASEWDLWRGCGKDFVKKQLTHELQWQESHFSWFGLETGQTYFGAG